jgi:hypothetical protein
MLMPDPSAALAETRRVLRPGRRLTFAVWGPPERNPFFSIVAMALVQGGHIPPPDPTAPGVFSMASTDRTNSLLDSAGFDDVRVDEVPVLFTTGDVDQYLSVVADTAGPIAVVLRGLPADEHDAVRAQVEEALGRFASDGGYDLPGLALCAVAR